MQHLVLPRKIEDVTHVTRTNAACPLIASHQWRGLADELSGNGPALREHPVALATIATRPL